MYKPGGTIAGALAEIQKSTYVLPAIQREFVWRPEQTQKLFDSLMQGYPFGTFLLWKIQPVTSGKFKFYDFVRNYHERDAKHCPELGALPNQDLLAVLDGQQRLTALNVGLRGSMSVKEPNKWWSNPDAFPKRTLRLNLLAPLVPDEDGALYTFRFLTDKQASQQSAGVLWFNVPEILGLSNGPAMLDWLVSRGLGGAELKQAYSILDRLHRVVHVEPLIHYYEEQAQDLERVLNIFIRLNSGGTVLSYSDLLLSVAVAQWRQVDARSEIHSLVDELNKIGTGFSLSKDWVLKAGLMLADIASVGFKVENFTHENMTKLEANWPRIRRALVVTIELAASFGFNGQTLRADSSLLPIAYYLYVKNPADNYVMLDKYVSDRRAIRDWLVRSLLKGSGIWGSGLDTLLTALRESIRTAGHGFFPIDQMRQTMVERSKGLAFSDEDIEGLLALEYGDRRIFVLLTLLFPFVDLRNQFHVDHVFPISRFKPGRLRKAGVNEDDVERFGQMANELPNLQLLEGLPNIQKRDTMPTEWLTGRYANESDRDHYCSLHLLGTVPESLLSFEAFYKERRDRLREHLKTTINLR